MSSNRGIEKQDVVQILLSHKKEWNSVICRDADGPRDCRTEWSKSERETQILDIKAYMWNLEKWYRWSYLQSRNGDTDVENKCMDIKGGKGGRMTWETGLDVYTLVILCVKQIINENLQYSTGNSTQCSVVTKMRRKSKKEGIDTCIHRTDSPCCTAETNKIS